MPFPEFFFYFFRVFILISEFFHTSGPRAPHAPRAPRAEYYKFCKKQYFLHVLHTDINSFLIKNNQNTHHSYSYPIRMILIPTSAFIFSMSEYFSPSNKSVEIWTRWSSHLEGGKVHRSSCYIYQTKASASLAKILIVSTPIREFFRPKIEKIMANSISKDIFSCFSGHFQLLQSK